MKTILVCRKREKLMQQFKQLKIWVCSYLEHEVVSGAIKWRRREKMESVVLRISVGNGGFWRLVEIRVVEVLIPIIWLCGCWWCCIKELCRFFSTKGSCCILCKKKERKFISLIAVQREVTIIKHSNDLYFFITVSKIELNKDKYEMRQYYWPSYILQCFKRVDCLTIFRLHCLYWKWKEAPKN